MFYQISGTMKPIEFKEVDEKYITAGYVSCDELEQIAEKLTLSRAALAACREANMHFRSGVEVYDDYTFTELRIINHSNPEGADDCVALYIRKNLIIVVDVEDYDGSTKKKFMTALNRYTSPNVTLEKIIYAFIDALVADDFKYIEDTGNEITQLEEDVLKENVGDDFNLELLQLKKQLLTMHNYYEQLLDITDAIDENENDIFDSEDLRYISNLTQKITRLREDTDSLSSTVTHLQDAYSSLLDLKLNHTMKLFTCLNLLGNTAMLMLSFFPS